MTSPFVPVDLNKLLDEFEENEAPISGQCTSLSEEDTRSLLNSCCKAPRQSFQPAFPCIQEEVFSDQGSDGRLEDKDDSGSDSTSISGVIAAAEAITSKGHDQMVSEQSVNCTTERSDISDAQRNLVKNCLHDAVLHQEEHCCFDNEQGMVDAKSNTCGSQSVSAASCHVINGYDASPEIQLLQNTREEKEGNTDGDLTVGNGILQKSEGRGKSQSDPTDSIESLANSSSTAEVKRTFCNSSCNNDHDSSGYRGLHIQTNSPSSGGDGNSFDLDVHQPVDNRATESVNSASLVEKQDDLQSVGHNGFESSNVVTQQGHESESQLGGLTEVSSYTVQNSTDQDVGQPTNVSQDPNQIPDPTFQLPNQDSPYQDLNTPMEPWESSSITSQISGSHAGMKPQGSTGARRISSGEACLGRVPPIWVPDSVATHCMNCGLKFTVVKRRHHCRACGKALCSSCCNMKFALPYMDNREGRVCEVCCNALLRAQTISQVEEQENNALENYTDNWMAVEEEITEDVAFLSPNDDQESTEVVEQSSDGIEEEGADSLTPHSGGVDATREHTVPAVPPLQLPDPSLLLPNTDSGTPLATPTSPALSDDSDCLFRLDVDNVRSLLPQGVTALPPVLLVINEEVIIQERPDPAEIMYKLKGCHETVVFMLNKNLVVKVKMVKLRCCMKCKCWCFVTEGMGAANQEEMVVLLECLEGEAMVPKDVLSHFNTAFAYAKQGHTVSELGYTIFGQPFLGSGDNAGFLYVKPTFQCLKNLPLPCTPYVVGVLIKRLETPWAQLFPLRLQLRLGAEYRYYPCPLISIRNRPAVYGELGHTIMNLLADFKNFQYTLARVTGLVIHMEENRTSVKVPQDRYDEIVKILNATDEHVMALGANFSQKADSHLVCIQNEQGYKTQAINIQNQARKVTGASFIVFSGALKTSSPFNAKVNIVEDGIMVQLIPKLIVELRHSLKEMQDYTIFSGIPEQKGDEVVVIEWVSRQEALQQASVSSPIDGLQLDCFPCVKVHSASDFTRKSVFRIQWTEVYFLGDRCNSGAAWQQSASRDLKQLTAELAKAFCQACATHLCRLNNDNLTLIGLRVNLDSDNVGYCTGSNNQPLAVDIMSDLDTVLVPVMHSAASRHRGHPLSVELFFKILKLL